MITVTATDYAWAEDEEGDIPHEYCLTLVRGLSPEEFLRRIDAEPGSTVTSMEALAEALQLQSRTRMRIGVTEVDGWALGFEVNGYLGVSDEINRPLSAGTRLVSHFCNVNALAQFVWREDGDLRLSFDPGFADDRSGSTPDALNEVMADIGFAIVRDDDADLGAFIEGAYALAEHLTGVRITAGLLSTATYRCGSVRR